MKPIFDVVINVVWLKVPIYKIKHGFCGGGGIVFVTYFVIDGEVFFFFNQL